MTRRRRAGSGSNGGLAVIMVAVAAGVAWYVNRPTETLDFVDDAPRVIEETPSAPLAPTDDEDTPTPVGAPLSEAGGTPSGEDLPAAAPPTAGVEAEVAAGSEPDAPVVDAAVEADAPDAAPPASADADEPDAPFDGRFAGREGLGGQIDVDAIRKRLGLDGDEAAPITRSRPRADVDALDVELAGLRARFELDPTDAEALGALVDALVARDRPDDAWMFVVSFGRAGGDPVVGRGHVLRLDPLVDARLDAYARVADLAFERVDGRRRPRNGLRDLDVVAALRDPLAPGAAGDAATRAASDGQAELVARLADARAELLDDDDAVESLADAGAPLPARLGGPRGIDDEKAAERDAKARASDRPIEQRGSRLRVRTLAGTRTAWAARRVVEEAREHVQDAFRRLRLRGPSGTLEVDVVDSDAAYHTERVNASEPIAPWRLAFYDGEQHRIVALDPVVRGEVRDVLWGELAREVARSHVRALRDERGVLPAWLEAALIAPYEATHWLGDGRVEVAAGWPRARREAVALAALDGAPMMRLDELLALDSADERGPTWAWALVTYLREARDEDDELLWDDRLTDLLEAERDAASAEVEGADARAFREHVIDPDRPRAGILSLRAFEEAWHGWLAEQGAWIRGDAEALDTLVGEAERLHAAGEAARAERLVRRALSADAYHVGAHALLAALRDEARDADDALLSLRNVAALQTRAGEPLPVARIAALDDAFATTLAAHDATARAALEPLISDYLAAGFPRAALRVVDRALSAEPLDAGWRATRDTILAVLGDDLLYTRDRLGVVASLDGVLGDKTLWQPDGSRLLVRCADRKAPTLLNSVARLREPWRLSARLLFVAGPDGRLVDDRSNYVGFTFGGEDPLSDGHWGVFVSPGGRVEIAQRASNLEWPSDAIGHAVRRDDPAIVLEVQVEGGRYTVFVDGVAFAPRRLGSKAPNGWMSIYARDVDVELSDLVVQRPASVRPSDVWHTAPRER